MRTMNVLLGALLWAAVCGATAFSQTVAAPRIKPLLISSFAIAPAHAESGFFYDSDKKQPGALADIRGLFSNPVTDRSDSMLFMRDFGDYGWTQSAFERSEFEAPYAYRRSNDGSSCFPFKLGRLQYTYCGTQQFTLHTSNHLQNLVDLVMRHFNSQPVVPVNAGCIRVFTCNSLYEQALRRKAALTVY